MNIQRAIEWQKAFEKTCNGIPRGVNKACEMAIKALEKQVPKKPVMVNVGHNGKTDGCPVCGKDFWEKVNFCPVCGQAIDWSEIESERDVN